MVNSIFQTKFKRLYDPLFFLLVTLTILSLNLTPLIMHTRHAPPGTTFASIHNNVQDYFFYLSLMNEGAGGDWMTYDPFTTEAHKPSIVFSYFLWLGKLSSFLHIPFNITYHASRVILGFLLFLAAWKLVRRLGIPYPRLAFLFFVFSSPLMRNFHDGTKIIVVPFMHWWTGMNPLRRAAYLPHHMLGGLLLILILIFIISYSKKPDSKNLIFILLLSILLSFILAPSLFILLLSIPLAVLVFAAIHFLDRKMSNPVLWLKSHSSFFLGLFLVFSVGLGALFLMIAQTSLGFPWSQYIAWEKKLQFPVQPEIYGALGILVPFAFIGTVKALLSRRFDYLLIVSLLFSPILFIPYAPKFGMSNVRIIQGLPYLPLSILAVLGINFITDLIIKFISFITGDARKGLPTRAAARQSEGEHGTGMPSGRTRKLELLITIFCLIIFAIYTYPVLAWSLRDQIAEYWPLYGNVYLDNRLFTAFRFINNNFPAKSKVLSTFYSGNMLPAYTHTISYAGHFGYTMDYQKKNELLGQFFTEKMPPEKARELLVSNKIDLVFQGPEEKGLLNRPIYPNLLKTVYDEGGVTIYKIK